MGWLDWDHCVCVFVCVALTAAIDVLDTIVSRGQNWMGGMEKEREKRGAPRGQIWFLSQRRVFDQIA